jgi:DNA-binding XRE family transcriptional regulator
MTVDWFRIITDLKKHEMSHTQQANEVQVTRKTIENWASGHTEPSYSKAVILLEVYRTVVGSTQ